MELLRQCKLLVESATVPGFRLDAEESDGEDLPPIESIQKAFGNLPSMEETEKAVQDLREGKITVDQVEELNAQWEDRFETCAKERADWGDVQLLMRLRAENEVRMTITSGFPFPEFAQRLVSDAFKAAALGTLESDWIGGVFSGPHAPVEPWRRDAYQRTIAWLREHGPWPWPREDAEVTG